MILVSGSIVCNDDDDDDDVCVCVCVYQIKLGWSDS